MTQTEKIEKLAEQWYKTTKTERWGGEELGFIAGYTQGQEDLEGLIIELIYELHEYRVGIK